MPDTAKLMSTYEISNERIIGQQLKKNILVEEREFMRMERDCEADEHL